MIEIPGDYGEGGGSIVRTAVALSAVTGKPCKIVNIRARRRNPGIQTQHLEAIKAVAKLCNAEIKGAEIGSTELEFYPKKLEHGDVSISIKTAGSVALVLQAIMIATANTSKQIKIEINGGATHGKWAPTTNYLKIVTIPILRKLGYNSEVEVKRYGFYPTGGGLVEAKIFPSSLLPIELIKRGKPIQVFGSCIASGDLAAAKVAERMQKFARERLFKNFQIVPEIKAEYVDASSTGGGCDFFVLYENSVIGTNAIAEKGKSAEHVSQEAIENLLENHNSLAPLDEHMADQIIPYMALAGGKVKAAKITEHTKTNIWVCEKFLDVRFAIDEGEKIIMCGKN